jgi:hypothetical protein
LLLDEVNAADAGVPSALKDSRRFFCERQRLGGFIFRQGRDPRATKATLRKDGNYVCTVKKVTTHVSKSKKNSDCAANTAIYM